MRRLWIAALLCLVMLLLVPSWAFAYPILLSPANAVTVTDNYALGYEPFFQYTCADAGVYEYLILVSTQPNIVTDSNSPYFGFFTSGTVADMYTYSTAYDASHPNNGDSPWYLPPRTYYWDVIDLNWNTMLGMTTIAHSEVRSFTVPAVTTTKPTMAISQSRIEWTVTQGDPNPTPVKVTYKVNPSSAQYWWETSGAYQNPSSKAWFTETTESDQVTCDYSANVSGLAPGVYTTSITVNMYSPGTHPDKSHPVVGSPSQIPVKLVVNPKPSSGSGPTKGSGSGGIIITIPPIHWGVLHPSFPIFNLPWVVVKASAPAATGSLSHKKKIKFKGTVSPSFTTTVTVTVQKLSKKGKWQGYKTLRVKSNKSTGRWSLALKLPKAKYRLMDATAQWGLYLPAKSGWKSVKVK